MKLLAPSGAPEILGLGNRLTIFWPTLLMHPGGTHDGSVAAGMMLPANGVPVYGFVIASGVGRLNNSLKSPECIFIVGTVLRNGTSSRISLRWSEPKINILFFTIAPPSWPPYWFLWKPSWLVAKKFRASSLSLRRNSQAAP